MSKSRRKTARSAVGLCRHCFQPPVQQLIKLTHPAPATPAQFFQLDVIVHHTLRATISFLISAMALAGFKPFGQVRAQFMMV